ncbi:MAG: flavin-containing monooxygenase, partial [Acidimicrobiales bacterium]
VILEKNAEVGGTWLENTYPGCRVDVANHLYSYSFAQTGDWPGFFSTQDVLLDYFRSCVDRFGLRRHIRFEAEVISATFDEARGSWTVVTRNGQGLEEVMECQAVVSAVGQLNRPSFPTIPGQDRFTGRSFHSARWEDDVNLIGRRVAVIGTGASAAQFIPHVAEQADTTVVFQRTPPWLIPTPEYHAGPAPGLRWLLGRVPSYSSWDRLWLFWRTHEGLLPMVIVDSQWDDGGRSVSALNDVVRQLFTAHLESEFPDAELLKKVLPQYPPGAKRVVRDDGSYSAALARPDLELITESIDCITEGGVRTRDGVDHDVDVIIYGTGFQASHFLMPMTVTGLGGVDLHQRWDGEARAYLGLTVPGFPNFFMLYGPNTNIVINGSIVYFSECGAHFILECIRTLLESEHRTMECRKDVHDAYNERIDVSNKEMAWGASDVHSWYKNASGRVAQNWPFSLLEYWLQTNRPDPADFVFD